MYGGPDSDVLIPGVFVSLAAPTLEDVNGDGGVCQYVMAKGNRRGERCGKAVMWCPTRGSFIPACLRHYGIYVDVILEREALTRIRHHKPVPVTEKRIRLEEIPRVIDRNDECSVCYEKEKLLILPCGHTVCYECEQKFINLSCPQCRAVFLEAQLRRL